MSINRRYYWLKLQKDFFTNKWVKKLKKLPGGYEYTVIYLEMMLMSIENNGYIYFDGVEKTFDEEIALTIGEDIDAVRITIDFLERAGLIVRGSDDDQFALPEVQENIGSETDGAVRSRRFRERHREEITGIEDTKLLPQQEFSGEKPPTIPSEMTKKKPEDYPTGFEEWWRIYPRKGDKGMAYRQYKARLNDGWSPEQLFEAAKAYADQTRRDKTEQKYIKQGKTFLGPSTPFADFLKDPAGGKSNGEKSDRDPYSEWS